MPSAHLTYTLRRLASRDEIVFKSVVGVLHGKTRHTWQHTGAADADLMVLGTQEEDDRYTEPQPPPGHAVIHLSHGGAAAADLTLPLRIADVILCLDRVGDAIAHRAVRPAAAAPAAAPVEPTQPSPRLSLARWPDAALLQRDFRYIKLATVLTGHPLSLPDLAERTQLPLPLCHDFVQALKAAGQLRIHTDQPAAPAAAPRTAPAAHHGLLARIRARLEMIVGTPTAK